MSKKQGINLICYDILDSTQLEAKRLLVRQDHDKPTLIIARSQLAGRGRLQRPWSSPKGNLYCTLAIKMDINHNIVPLASSIGLAKGLGILHYPKVRYKWPNDLLWEDKKFAGILIEKVDNMLLIGMGVNLITHPTDHYFPSTCLQEQVIPIHQDITALASLIANALIDTLQTAQYSSQSIIDLWLTKAYRYQEDVLIRTQGLRGRFIGISKDGAMMLMVKGNIQYITFGDVSS